MSFGLSPHTLSILQDFFARQPTIECVKIYGSRALGTYKKGSDIDFAIYTTTPEHSSAHILSELDALPTPYLFDVVNYDYITHAPLKAHIDQYGKIFYSH